MQQCVMSSIYKQQITVKFIYKKLYFFMMNISILVVIVLFNPKNFLALMELCKDKNIHILVYDNSKYNSVDNCILFKNPSQITYIHDPSNPGVSKAYNKAFELAKLKGIEYVLLLDQDTNINIGHLSEYRKAIEIYGKDFIYSPLVVSKTKTLYSPYSTNIIIKQMKKITKIKKTPLQAMPINLKNKTIINSALLIPLNIYKKIGGYNELIKLDFSDFFFIKKYKSYKKESILLPFLIEHSISGDGSMKDFQEKIRFDTYLEGGRHLYHSYPSTTLFIDIFLRSLKLSLKYKKLYYINAFFKELT